ncbi:hypothetical protein RF55_18587, partial [Lasius niger]
DPACLISGLMGLTQCLQDVSEQDFAGVSAEWLARASGFKVRAFSSQYCTSAICRCL